MKEIDVKQLAGNPFDMIGDQWMLITAGTAEHCNTMTASWGGFGITWGRNTATIFLRPQRYTKEFIEAEEGFSLCFFDECWRPQLQFCGTRSGRDTDKVKECGFQVETWNGTPYFAQAKLVLICRKLYWQDLDPSHFLDETLEDNYRKKHDYHRVYVGEITAALQAD